IKALARELEPFDNLNLSGGEPFLRKEFAEICRFFITNNGVKEIYVPTNGWYTDKTLTALETIFQEESLRYFVCELSIDGMPEYQRLYEYIRRLWAPREEGRYGSVVEPMLQWAKMRTLEQKRQVVPCKAGVLSAVVYANGDVSVCEMHTPLGNLRQKTFREMW